MLDPAILKDNLEVLESNISRRNLKIDVNHLISLKVLKAFRYHSLSRFRVSEFDFLFPILCQVLFHCQNASLDCSQQ